MVTKKVIDQFISLWKCKQFVVFVRPPPPSPAANESETRDSEIQSDSVEDQSKKPKPIDTNYLFSMILSPVYVFAQQNKSPTTFDKLAEFIAKLIKNDLMNVAFLNEQGMKLMHLEWNQVFSLNKQIMSTYAFDCRCT